MIAVCWTGQSFASWLWLLLALLRRLDVELGCVTRTAAEPREERQLGVMEKMVSDSLNNKALADGTRCRRLPWNRAGCAARPALHQTHGEDWLGASLKMEESHPGASTKCILGVVFLRAGQEDAVKQERS